MCQEPRKGQNHGGVSRAIAPCGQAEPIKRAKGPGVGPFRGAGGDERSGTVAAGEAALEGGCIGDGSEVVSHLREDWYARKGRGLGVGLVLSDRKAQAKVSLPLGRKVGLAYCDRVDVPDRALRLLDQAQRDHQRVDELLEVVPSLWVTVLHN